MTVAPDSDALPATSIWIFGFGSLVHTPGFAFKGRVQGLIRGYRRVFWQGSTDHRGVPGAPGRVVTLHEEPGDHTWGVAYELAGSRSEQERTLHYLEWREKQYDIRRHVAVYASLENQESVIPEALVYIAGPDKGPNPDYLGPAPLPRIAETIATAVGPSGPNYVYLFRLANALEKVMDARLIDLVSRKERTGQRVEKVWVHRRVPTSNFTIRLQMKMDDHEVFELRRLVRQYMESHGLPIDEQLLHPPKNSLLEHAEYWRSVENLAAEDGAKE